MSIVKEVKKKKRKERIEKLTGAILGFIEDTGIIDSIEDRRYRKETKKMGTCFEKMLTPESLTRINGINSSIEKIERTISASGWWRTSDGYMYEDNFKNMHDPEFREWDTYRIYRGENGYYVSQEEPYNGYFASIRQQEQAFFDKYQGLLEALHILLTERDKFYAGEYKLKDESDRDLADQILVELGLKKEKELVK